MRKLSGTELKQRKRSQLIHGCIAVLLAMAVVGFSSRYIGFTGAMIFAGFGVLLAVSVVALKLVGR